MAASRPIGYMDIDDRVRAAQDFLDYRGNEILGNRPVPEPSDWGEHLKHNLIKQLARNIDVPSNRADVKRLIEAILGE